MSVAELMAPPRPYAPFALDAEYVWLQCNLDGYKEFWVECRMNLTNGERKRLKLRMDEIADLRKAVETRSAKKAKTIDERWKAAYEANDAAALEKIIDERVAHIADLEEARRQSTSHAQELLCPYIRNWNVQARADDGELYDAPAPQAAGIDAFDAIDETMASWLFVALMRAYRGNGLATVSSKTSTEPVALTPKSSETTPVDEPPDSNSDLTQASPNSSDGLSLVESTT